LDKLITWATGGLFSAAAYLFAGVDDLLIAFLIFMIVDYTTGLMLAAVERRVSSQRGFKGVAKKIGMLFFIIIAVQLDIITGQGHAARVSVLFFLIGVEGISILENLGGLGLPIPSAIRKAFERFKDDNE
jgi:toxin secretion/phage lysis holin